MLLKFTPVLLGLVLALEEGDDKTVSYSTPQQSASHFQESFDSGIPANFIHTEGTKQDADQNKYSGEFINMPLKNDALANDLGIVASEKAKHYGIASKLNQPFAFADEDKLVISYEVAFQSGVDCGGGYIKLFADDENLNLKEFHDKTLFSIMFGPDKCANDYKLHLILNHKDPITGDFEEKHLKEMPSTDDLKKYYSDNKPHVYKLTMTNSDSKFSISIDGKIVKSGDLLKDMKPDINPPKEIEDPNATKPLDWDEEEFINDPDAVKPEDWDEDAPQMIDNINAKQPDDWREDLDEWVDDPDAVMPDDWDEDMDGEYEAPQIKNSDCDDISGCGIWEAPQIKNPDYKGPWKAPKIKNPNYLGPWSPPIIENPNYFEDKNPFATAQPIGAVAIEIWSMNSDVYFDNIYIGNDEKDNKQFVDSTFGIKLKQQKANQPSIMEKLKTASEDKTKLIIGSVLGIGVLTILMYFACFKKSTPKESAKNVKFSETNEEKVISEPEDEDQENSQDDQNLADTEEDDTKDSEPSKTNLESSRDSNAGGDHISQSSDGDADSESSESSEEEVKVQKSSGPRKRNARRKAD